MSSSSAVSTSSSTSSTVTSFTQEVSTQTLISTTPRFKRGNHSMGDSNMLQNNNVPLWSLLSDYLKNINERDRRHLKNHFVDKNAFSVLENEEKESYILISHFIALRIHQMIMQCWQQFLPIKEWREFHIKLLIHLKCFAKTTEWRRSMSNTVRCAALIWMKIQIKGSTKIITCGSVELG